jgi:hypothetical protein
MHWSGFVAQLPENEHHRLVLALGNSLREIRLAALVPDRDGEIDELRQRLNAAIAWLVEARQALDG